MKPALALIAAFVNPLLADSGPLNSDAIPTWSLAGACIAFLLALGATIRFAARQIDKGAKVVYADVIKPAGLAHIGLMNTLSDTRIQDSESLKSIAETQRAIQGDIESIRTTNGKHNA